MSTPIRGPRLIRLGLIGISADFREVFVPVFLKYLHRIQVVSVFDPKASVSKTASRDVQAHATRSLARTMENRDIDGLICLRGGWYQQSLARLAHTWNKPLLDFVGQDVVDPSKTASWDTVTPALLTRYQPAMMRLRELISTQLGQAQGIEIWLDPSEPQKSHRWLTETLDWGLTLLGRDIQGVVPNADGSIVSISLHRQRPTPQMVEMVVHRASKETTQPIAKVSCSNGIVEFRSGRELAWNGVETQEEKVELLDDERRPEEIIIDHFCRRLAGGLIPVPEWKDHVQASVLASNVLECLALGR